MKTLLLGSAALLLAIGQSAAQVGVKPEPAKSAISIQGSDTMLQVNLALADGYRTKTGKRVVISGEGSSTGFKALVDGTAQIAASSRPVKDSEVKAIKKKHMEGPKELVAAYDAIAVYLHPSNPVDSLTFEQLGSIYGKGGKAESWSEFSDKAKDRKIRRAGRANSSGTYAAFKRMVVPAGFGDDTAAMAGSAAVVEFVATTEDGIGYSGKSFKTDGVKFAKVGKAGADPVEPTDGNIQSGKYPLSRPLYLYTIGEPKGEVKEFLDWIHSKEGHKIIAEEGFVPPAAKEKAK